MLALSQRAAETVVAAAMFLATTVAAQGNTRGWVFLPTGKDGKTDYSAPGLDDSKWRPAAFPHQDWEKLQPQDNVYGWYRLDFVWPRCFAGRDVIVNFGVIDDAAEVYLNGKLVGRIGSMPPAFVSAWLALPSMRMPSAQVNPGRGNTLAVKVFDRTGIGGMLEEPWVGASLVDGESRWRFNGCGADANADYSGAELDDSAWVEVDVPDRPDSPGTLEAWQRLALPKRGWDARQPQDDMFGWYRLRFDLPEVGGGERLALALGRVCDLAAVYVNGVPIGGGCDRDLDELAYRQPRGLVLHVPSKLIQRNGPNVLAVKVFNSTGLGGLIDNPSWSVMSHGVSQGANDISVRPRGSSPEHLRRQIVRAGAAGDDSEALRLFADLAKQFPRECLSYEAIWGLCQGQRRRGRLVTGATRLAPDKSTRGNWAYSYGTHGFVLCAALGSGSLVGLPGRFVSMSAVVGGQSPDVSSLRFTAELAKPTAREPYPHPYQWVSSWETRQIDALTIPVYGIRRAAWWDDRGELHPFDSDGPDLKMRVSLGEGSWVLSLYFYDHDWGKTPRPRRHGITIMTPQGQLCAVDLTGKSVRGQYRRFLVSGRRELIVRIHKLDSVCVALSGIFLDAVPAPLSLGILEDGVGHSTRADWGAKFEGLCREWHRTSAPVDKLRADAESLLQAVAGESTNHGRLTDVCRSWVRWQLASALCLPMPQVLEHVRAFLTNLDAIERAAPRQMTFLGSLASDLLAHSRIAEAALISERIVATTPKRVNSAVLGAARSLADKWLQHDYETATVVFQGLLRAVQIGPDGPARVERLALLGTDYFQQGHELVYQIDDPDGWLPDDARRGRGIPSFPVLAWQNLVRHHPPSLVRNRAGDFARKFATRFLWVNAPWANSGLPSRPAYWAGLCGDIVGVFEPDDLLHQYAQATRVNLLCDAGDLEAANEAANAALDPGRASELPLGLEISIRRRLAIAALRRGDLHAAEKTLLELQHRLKQKADPVAQNLTVTVYRWLADIYRYLGSDSAAKRLHDGLAARLERSEAGRALSAEFELSGPIP